MSVTTSIATIQVAATLEWIINAIERKNVAEHAEPVIISDIANDLVHLRGIQYFYMLRHSKTTWLEEQLKEGFIDSSLSLEGITQSMQAAQKLSPRRIKVIVSSPLKRCIETASIVSYLLGGRPIYEDRGLISRDYGSHAYVTAGWTVSPSAATLPENFDTFVKRVNNAIFRNLMRYGDGVLFVSHGCVEEALVKQLHLQKDSLGSKTYGSPTLFENHENAWFAHRISRMLEVVSELKPIKNAFYFLRHGRTNWNKDMLELGPQDLSLNLEGVAEVEAAVSELLEVKITRIITSRLRRCVESAEIIARNLGGIPIIIEPELRERYFGNWAMQKERAEELKSISANGPGFFASIRDKVEAMLPSDAENQNDFENRIIHYLNNSGFNIPGENTLVIAHGCIRQILTDHLHLTDNRTGPKKYGKPLVFEPKKDGSWSAHPVRSDSNERN